MNRSIESCRVVGGDHALLLLPGIFRSKYLDIKL